MKKMWWKIAIVTAVVLVSVPLIAAAGSKGGQFKDAEGMVKLVTAFYKGCQSQEASTIMAELSVCDMADKGQCDAIPELEANLARLKNPALKNFTRFLISDQAKKKGDKDRQLAELRKIMEENAQ
jgi:hypothetical protein